MSNKPNISLSSVSTGEGPSMITTINFSGGLLKDTRLERQDGSRGHSLVVHGQHEVEEFFTGIVCAAARFETWKKRVAGVEDVAETKVDVAVAADPVVPVEDTPVAESDGESEDTVPSEESEGDSSPSDTPAEGEDK